MMIISQETPPVHQSKRHKPIGVRFLPQCILMHESLSLDTLEATDLDRSPLTESAGRCAVHRRIRRNVQ